MQLQLEVFRINFAYHRHRIKEKRNNIISEFITFRITKAKAKVKFGVRYLCGPECERSSVPININTKAKANKYFSGIRFTLISVWRVHSIPS